MKMFNTFSENEVAKVNFRKEAQNLFINWQNSVHY